MIISKKDFVEIIDRLKNYNILQDKINELFENCLENRENDFANAGGICIGHETIVIKLLEKMFNDTETISWWIYEMDYGRCFLTGDFEVNGQAIDLSTTENLYDYLIQELEEKNNYE